MRITVVETEGVPDGCILSIKAGEQRRQIPLCVGGQSLRLDNTSQASGPLRVDLLDRLASCSPESLLAGDHTVELEPTRELEGKIRLHLRIEEDTARPSLGAEGLASTGQLGSLGVALPTPVAGGTEGGDREAKIAAETRQYLDEHQLMRAMRGALSRVLREKPQDAHRMLAEEILRLGASRASPTHGGTQPTNRRRRSTDTKLSNEQWTGLFGIPALSPEQIPLRILDLGSGEVGFYSYGDSTSADGIVSQKGGKMKADFLAEWVKSGRAEEFADEILQRYDDVKPQDRTTELMFIAGATGIHRESLQEHHTEREAVRAFEGSVSASLSAKLGCICRLRIFVPSGQLEASFELRAVEWLLEQCPKDSELQPDTVASFTGTLSAGGGSSQLSVRGGVSAVQLFSVPFGNKKPLSDGLFSKPPTQEEVANWATRVREALHQQAFPHCLDGLFVGISATFYAASESSCADRVIGKQEAIEALTARINECTNTEQGPNGEKAARGAANVALVRELIDWVLSPQAQILFRRNWDVHGKKAAATWTLGLYAEAQDSMRERYTRPPKGGTAA